MAFGKCICTLSRFGEKENRAPSEAFASFDAEGYLAANADAAAAVTAGVFHPHWTTSLVSAKTKRGQGRAFQEVRERLVHLLLLLRVLIA